MKRTTYFLIAALAILLASCTAQSRLSSRLNGEWNIEKFESRTAAGSSTSIENAGSITFGSGGRGSQAFSTAIAQAGQATATDFRWDNTANTVSIRGEGAEFAKVWIIVDSGRSKMRWFSTDSQGNVQVMNLRKKK